MGKRVWHGEGETSRGFSLRRKWIVRDSTKSCGPRRAVWGRPPGLPSRQRRPGGLPRNSLLAFVNRVTGGELEEVRTGLIAIDVGQAERFVAVARIAML